MLLVDKHRFVNFFKLKRDRIRVLSARIEVSVLS